MKKEKVTVGVSTIHADFWSTLFQRFLFWDRLRRVVGWLSRVFNRPMQSLSQKDHNRSLKYSPKPLSIQDVDKAEKKIVKFVQKQSFADKKSETVTKGRLARLKPFEDEGIIRVGERLNNSNLPYDAKHPIILPAKHPVSDLIIAIIIT